MNTCIFENLVCRLPLAKRIACSLLVVTISVCMLPDAKADFFTDPSGIGTTIYEDQFGTGTVAAKFVAKHTRGFTSWQTSQVQLHNAPTGLAITGGRTFQNAALGCPVQSVRQCIEIDLSWSSTANVSSDTAVIIRVLGQMFSSQSGISTSSLYDVATFTIKPTVKELRVSTPTNSSTVTEAGTTSTFTVRLGQAPSSDVTVSVASSDTTEGTVSPNALTFTSTNYNTAQTVTVTGANDNIYDGSQSWNVVLDPSSSGDSGYNSLSDVNVAMTTPDDESAPAFSIDSPSVAEGDSSSTNLTFTVSLNPASASQHTVDYADAGSGTATSGTDYASVAGGTLTFAAGEASKTITVSVTGDTTNEANETVVLTLSNASSGTSIATASGTGTITDDDTPSFSIDSPSVTEGDEEESTTLTFTVTLEPAAMVQATVNYADAGTGTAESGVDYTAITGGTLTFAAGETSKTIDVSVIGDILSEPDETVVIALSNVSSGARVATANGTGTITDNDASVLDELDTEIVAEVSREVTTSVLTAVSSRIASVAGGATTVVQPSGFSNSGLLSILERALRHDRERDRGLPRSEMSLYRSLDGESFVYSPGPVGLGASSSADAPGGGLFGSPTVWGSVDYRKLSGRGADALNWGGELASVNIGTDTMSESDVLVGLAIGMSKGSFGYQGSIGGVVKVRLNTLNPYVGWTLSELASLWVAVGYGRGKINYNDDDIEEVSSKMSLASAALGGRYRLSADGSADGRLIQVDLKGEAWGLRTKVKGNAQRLTGSKSQAHGVRIAVEGHRSGVLESSASLSLSGEAGLRWDGGDGDTGTGFEIGGSADYSSPETGMKVIATARALLEHESDRKEWGASLTAGFRLGGRETGLTYRSSLSHGQAESGVDSLWNSSAASRAPEENSLATRLEAEVGYRLYGVSGLHTPYVGFGAKDGGTRDYRIGMRYASGSAVSSGLEFERREASSKRPDHRIMLTGQMNW